MTAFTVCVNYSDILQKTLPRMNDIFEVIYIVSDNSDKDTEELSNQTPNAVLIRTDVFYRNGASFNKGGAMSTAWNAVRNQHTDQWLCVLDCDIRLPVNFPKLLPELKTEYLYGSRRYQAQSPEDEWSSKLELIPDADHEMPGYFWIFHTGDSHLPSPNKVMWSSWQHAGNYDTEFKNRWPRQNRIKLDLGLVHLGEPNKNWWGRGKADKMKEMYRERRKKKGYSHERV